MNAASVSVPTAAPALAAAELTVQSPRGPIVEQIELAVAAGETLAIVGESGSGKTVTSKALTGLLPHGLHATGTLSVAGQAVPLGDRDDGSWRAIRGRRIALIPQDPFTSLSPRHRCGAQIGAVLRDASRSQRAARVAAALDEVGLPARVARQYPFQLSGGMRQRVAIAAALINEPTVVIADEATTALDVTTQHEILELLKRLQGKRGTALILITHDLSVAAGRADRVLVLYAGRVAERGPCDVILRAPAHPYTGRLLDCDPPLHIRLARLPSIPGSVPQLASVGRACTFAGRCELVTDECQTAVPPLLELEAGHRVACVNSADFRQRQRASDIAIVAASPADEEHGDGGEAPDKCVLSVHALTKRFGQTVALDAVELGVGRGESVAVVGESGSGKTTLARIVVGLETADSGSVEFPQHRDETSPARRAQIVFQDPYSALNPSRSVGASLRDALDAGGRDRSEVPALLEKVGLPERYADRRPRALSGGERQRVAIARALAVRPDLLVCDEAVSSLDVSVQAQILNLIADLREQLRLSVLFISHDLGVVRQVADRVYVLYRGKLVEHGAASYVLDHPTDSYTRLLMDSVPKASR